MLHTVEMEKLCMLIFKAGESVMEIYSSEFDVDLKDDLSPITKADRISNKILVDGLKHLYPKIPIISEESRNIPYTERRNWEYFWLIDPLDGTKEFIKRNGEFAINIALIYRDYPVAGIIYIPSERTTYFAKQHEGSYRIDKNGKQQRLRARAKPEKDKLVVVGSRSHTSEVLNTYLSEQKKKFRTVKLVSLGSSIKFCLVAEGTADVYLRTGPTMEWDTAAGHAIIIESGKQVYVYNTGQVLKYNKETLQNQWFHVR
jgi:3'(2'), 5'-bisphosphate nucleotidase